MLLPLWFDVVAVVVLEFLVLACAALTLMLKTVVVCCYLSSFGRCCRWCFCHICCCDGVRLSICLFIVVVNGEVEAILFYIICTECPHCHM